jgi:hypothetical protein
MNNIFKLLVCFILTGFVITACQPDAHKEVGDPRDIIPTLTGTWKLTKALQVDEDASRKGFPYKELDITSLFPYTDFQLTLNANGKIPSTFATVAGNSPKIVKLAAGNWTVDDPSFPKVITLTSGSTTEKMTLGSYPVGATKSLKVRVERRDASAGDKLLISYTYEFAKQ